MYNRHNFYNHTFCIFTEVNIADTPSFKNCYSSKKGSSYYFTAEGVYRKSNHWGRVANCRWQLSTKSTNVNQVYRVGYANWTDFHTLNTTERLFYITINWNSKKVSFQHKNNNNYNGEALKNVTEAKKTIQTIKKLLKDKKWAKYLHYNNYEIIQREIIEKLITTNDSFITIKKNILKQLSF